MITRYSRKEMQDVWSAENKFNKWLDVEIAACEAHVTLGNISREDVDLIKKNAAFNVDRIDEIEREVNHDVIAFLTCVAEHIDNPVSRFVHLGLTSSDVVDTALALLIQDAGQLLVSSLEDFLDALKKQAHQHKNTLMMGRTHGVHAEPLTLGLKLTLWYDETRRNLDRLKDALEMLRVGKISGAVGNFAHMPPELEASVCEQLGLKPAPVSNQILQRDRHAQFMSTLAIIGGTLEKIATEIRACQKPEFNELLEPFSKKQKGSSAMPHKKNPIMCERITGLSRVLRGFAVTSLENQCLWHERDISHSSTERIIFPDGTALLDYMLVKMTDIVSNMTVNEEQMKENLKKSYNIFFSQQLLLKMVEKGITREDAYRIVQRNALEAFEKKELFDEKIRSDKDITSHITDDELNELFSYEKYTKNLDTIYTRVFG